MPHAAITLAENDFDKHFTKGSSLRFASYIKPFMTEAVI